MSQTIAISVPLSAEVERDLRSRADKAGQSISDAAAQIIGERIAQERSKTLELLRKSDESLAGFRKDVEESGMSEEEINEFFDHELKAMRAEKRAAREGQT